MKKYLHLVFIMSAFLPLFGAEQVQYPKPYLLDKSIDNAWNAIRDKYMVLHEVEKLFPDDTGKNIVQWLLRLKYFRPLKRAQDIFFRQLLSFCVAPSLQKEKEWKLSTHVFRTCDCAYYLLWALQDESKNHCVRIYDAQGKKEIAMIEGRLVQMLTKKAVLLLRSGDDARKSCFFYDIVQGKKYDSSVQWSIKINDDETLIAGKRDQTLYVQKIPMFDNDVDEIMSEDSIECKDMIYFIEFTSSGTMMVGFQNGSMQLFTIDKSSDGGLKAVSIRPGTIYSGVVPPRPCVSRHRHIGGADEYIIRSDMLHDERNSCGIRVTANGIEQQFYIKSANIWDYLGDKTLLAVDSEPKNLVILNYVGEKIFTGDKITIGGSGYFRNIISYITDGEQNNWVTAMAYVMRDEKGNGIGFQKKVIEEVFAVPGRLEFNTQLTLMLCPMREPKDSYGVYDLATNKLMSLNDAKETCFHANGCSILFEGFDGTRKKIPLYPEEKKMHFKRMAQECKVSQYFALEALHDEAMKL